MKYLLKRAWGMCVGQDPTKLAKTVVRLLYLRSPESLRISIRLKVGRLSEYPGIGDPFRVYYLYPGRIMYKPPPEIKDLIIRDFNILPGDWDERKSRLSIKEEYSVYGMFHSHFVCGTPWEDTKRYHHITSKLSEGKSVKPLSTKEQTIDKYNEYLCFMDHLYDEIKNKGYQPQEEISENNDFVKRQGHPSLDEVQVCIGRNGDVFLLSGYHRLAIAKILSIDQIPVRTAIRHEGWQTVRDKIYTNNMQMDTLQHYSNHPELEDIINS